MWWFVFWSVVVDADRDTDVDVDTVDAVDAGNDPVNTVTMAL